jgi:hypothetical protein
MVIGVLSLFTSKDLSSETFRSRGDAGIDR